MTPLAQKALQIAKDNLGKREATGRNDGPFVRMLQRWAANGAAWMEGQPWCVAHATYCIAQAHRALGTKPRIPEKTSTSRLYNWLKREGLLLSKPVPGCIGMVIGGPTGHSHTFLVANVTPDGIVHGIDGNWKSSVCWTKRPVSSCHYGQIV